MGICLESKILFILLLPIWIVIRLIAFRLCRARGNFSLKREVVLNVFFIYILCLIGVTLFPLRINFDRDYIWVSVNAIPFMRTIKDIINITDNPNMYSFMIKFWIKNIGGNLILLLPLGILIPILWSRFNSAVKTVFVSFCLSLSIEVLQLISFYIGNAGRAFDVDDILLNTIGAYIGYIIYKRFIESSRSSLNKYLQKV
ncbi:VanZ family protein [Clostridium swellfunianum]|uniref:VanZ family protein n=1 Tax=Clostridium swellfunianum TaxID=1367462 RepID=UPI00202EAB07|nr:VanZ family protein [Clostridium swellfunianum]MCM0650156.1 VanZ family protein [Clostridium swellfunianum]